MTNPQGPTQPGPGQTPPGPPYQIGQVVNGHVWNGRQWVVVQQQERPPQEGYSPQYSYPAQQGYPPQQGFPPAPGFGPSPMYAAAVKPPRPIYQRWWVWAAGGLVLLMIIGAVAGGGDTTPTASPGSAAPAASATSQEPSSAPSESTADETSSPSAEVTEDAADQDASAQAGPRAPSDEAEFIAIVQKGIAAGESADNDLKVGLAMKKRDRAICKLDVTKPKDWTGTITTLDSNGDGDGILTLELADGISVGTWNNAFSDINDNTLIKSSKLLDRLSEMSEGEQVTFSGSFIKESETCIANKGLTKVGKLMRPEFVFRFSAVKAS